MNFTKGVNTVVQAIAVLGVGSVAIPADSPTWVKVVLVIVAVGQALVAKFAHKRNEDGTHQSVAYGGKDDPLATGELNR